MSLLTSGLEVILIAPNFEKASPIRLRLLCGPRAKTRAVRMLYSLFVYPILALRTKAEVIHFHDPELLIAGVWLRLLGRKVIYDVHEDVPADVSDKKWIPARLRRPLAVLIDYGERACARCMSRIVAATPSIAKRFRREQVVLVQNFPLLSEMEIIRRSYVPYGKRSDRFVYIGSITEIRGARSMLKALDILCASSQTQLALGGEIWPEALRAELQSAASWDQVDWLGWCDRGKMMEELGKARAGLVLFLPAKNHIEAQPNKLFEYMSAGIPVIASDFPLWREIIDTAKCGLLVDPNDPFCIASAMKWILDNPIEAAEMGRRGHDAVLSRYNWEKEAESLVAMYAVLESDCG
jgi:glycosyltransferase involved in cell wall biosynthesis